MTETTGWFALQKLKGKVAFIHIPTVKNTSDGFLEKMKAAFGEYM